MKVELWKNDLLPNVTLTSSSYSDHSFQPHFHDHYVIMIVNEGVNEGVCEKQRFRVTPGEILFINPGEVHTGNSYQSKHLKYSAFYVDADFFTRHMHVDRPPVFAKMHQTNNDLAEGIKLLLQSTRSSASAFEIEEKKAKTFGEVIDFARSLRPSEVRDLPAPSVQKIKSFIKDQYNHQFTLEDLARHAGLSPYHLIRSFKQAVGITPFQFLRNYRIEKAKQELLNRKPIAEVALEVGFYDQSHFHKHFKLVTGVTPREFQRH